MGSWASCLAERRCRGAEVTADQGGQHEGAASRVESPGGPGIVGPVCIPGQTLGSGLARSRPQHSLVLQTDCVENLRHGTLGQIDEQVVSANRLLLDVDEPRFQALQELALRKEFVAWVRGALGGADCLWGFGAECPGGAWAGRKWTGCMRGGPCATCEQPAVVLCHDRISHALV